MTLWYGIATYPILLFSINLIKIYSLLAMAYHTYMSINYFYCIDFYNLLFRDSLYFYNIYTSKQKFVVVLVFIKPFNRIIDQFVNNKKIEMQFRFLYLFSFYIFEYYTTHVYHFESWWNIAIIFVLYIF